MITPAAFKLQGRIIEYILQLKTIRSQRGKMQTNKKNVKGIHRRRHSLKNPDCSHVEDEIKTKTNKTKIETKTKSKHKNKNQSYLELLNHL